MRIFKLFALVCLFFFMIACEESPKRLVPVDESGDGSDTTDTTPSDTDAPDSDNPDTGSSDTDAPDSDSPDTDSSDTDSTDNDVTDSDSSDTDSSDTDSSDTDSSDTDSPDTEIPDTEVPDTETPDTEAPDTEVPDGDTDTPEPAYCSAVFDGSSSLIEVAHKEALNLSSETWTIEAWIKQTDSLTSNAATIIGKKNGNNKFTYSLSNYYITKTTVGIHQSETTTMKGSATYSVSSISAEATGLSNSGDWTHIALVQTMKSEGFGLTATTKPSLALYVNGSQVKTGDLNVTIIGNQKITIATSNDPLLIGSGFKGLIDSIKISSTAKYTGKFTPAKLSVDSDTVALWDFNGSADDYEGDMTSTPKDITYSTDCKE